MADFITIDGVLFNTELITYVVGFDDGSTQIWLASGRCVVVNKPVEEVCDKLTRVV